MHLSSKSYTLDGAVGDTYLPPTQSTLVPNMEPTRPGTGENGPSLQGHPSTSFIFWSQPEKAEEPVSESCAFGDPLRRTSEVKHSSVTYAPNNTTWETESGEVRVSDTYIMRPPSVVRGSPCVRGELRRGRLANVNKIYPIPCLSCCTSK
ncbi:hypothetical protein EDD17DRAFT_1640979 [Pisolithus thermaeus]|nr:hypothetical protein EDD17DRAFT_1640979 [Pisolithus thermaeus]